MAIEYFWTGGTILVPILAYLSLGQAASGGTMDHNAWRWFVALCAIPCVISTILGIMFVPESPRWLVAEGHHEKALKILRQAAARNGKDPYKVFPEGTRIKDDEGSSEESTNFLDLLHPKWRKLNLKLWAVWAGFAVSFFFFRWS
jgi:MFS family permease